MTTAIWPEELTEIKPLVNGYSEDSKNLVIRSQTDAGVAKVRRRYTAAVKPITANVRLSTAQVPYFETFFETTLLGGSLPFEWINHRTGAKVNYRFVTPPKITPAGSALYWNIEMSLEVMP